MGKSDFKNGDGEEERSQEPVDVFWTGGWDSTFRVIKLLADGKNVKPHYIRDPGRPSTESELAAMRRLRELLENHPGVSGQLYESKIVSRYDYPAVEEIQEAYNELIKIRYIGDQYRWIPEYCRHEGLDSIEVSVESDNEFLRKHYNDEEYPFGVLFQSLEFPLIKYSKIDMKEWCEKQGFMDVMELTWFCHTPTKAGSPCGTCRPCIIVMERGLDYRMPLSARYRYHLRILPRIKGFLKRYSRIYAVLVKTKSELKK